MRVFLSCVRKDVELAEKLESELKRREIGVFTDANFLNAGEELPKSIERLIQESDATIALITENSEGSEWQRHEVEVALKAWSNGKLIVVAAENVTVPVGLRDIIDYRLSVSEPIQEQLSRIARELSNEFSGARPHSDTEPFDVEPAIRTSEPAYSDAPASERRLAPRPRGIGTAILAGAAVLGIASFAVSLLRSVKSNVSPDFIWEIPAQLIENSGWILGILGAFSALIVTYFGWRVLKLTSRSYSQDSSVQASRPSSGKGTVAINVRSGSNITISIDGKTEEPSDIFTSYSRQNMDIVKSVVNSMRSAGLTVWIDTEKQTATRRYAANISKAMRSAKLVVVACSEHAFNSDHVVREVYLAGDMKKDFAVLVLENVEIPDELNYFLTGYPRLDISAISPTEVGHAVRALLPA